MTEPAWRCASCTGENPGGMRFCGHCGAARDAPQEPPSPLPLAEADVPTESTDARIAEVLKGFVSGAVADRIVAAGGRFAEERRLVTALFADLSGFTPLAARLDPEQLLDVIDPVITGLSDVVAEYGGYVDKFAGDALLAFFGAPVSHEDDAIRAVLVATEMHRRLPEFVTSPEAGKLTLHIGINTGHVVARVFGSEVRMDYSVLGEAVILAQRLESVAPAGATYVGRRTHELTHQAFHYEPLGEFELKGRPKPEPAWQVLRRRRVRAAGAGAMVGRNTELRIGTALVDATAAGHGSILTVIGEAGTGKSMLLDTVEDHATARGVVWLHAPCASYGDAQAYHPYAEMLRSATGVSVDADAGEVRAGLQALVEALGLPQHLPAAAQLVGVGTSADGLRDLEPEGRRRILHDAVIEGLDAQARRAPTVLHLGDVHWLDAASLALTAEIIEHLRTAPGGLSLVLSGRPEAADTLRTLLLDVAPSRRDEIELTDLGRDAVADLVDGELGGPADARVHQLVADRSAGNPLFARETLRALLDAGDVVQRGDRFELAAGFDATGLPATVEGLLATRIDALPRAATEVLQAASVLGQAVSLGVLRRLTEHDVEDAVATLLKAGMWLPVSAEEVSFRHALIADVAYERMLRRTRQELHRQAAAAIEEVHGRGADVLDELARHHYLGQTPRALDLLLQAGERARSLFANHIALLHLRRALELVREQDRPAYEQASVLLDLAEVLDIVGDYPQAADRYAEVVALSGDVRGYAGRAAMLRKQNRWPEALAALDDAEKAPIVGDERELWAERAAVEANHDNYPAALQAAEQGLSFAPDATDATAGRLLVWIARSHTLLGDTDAAIDAGQRAVAAFSAAGALGELCRAERVLGYAYARAERHEEATESLKNAVEVARRIGNGYEVGQTLITSAATEHNRGRYAEAAALDQEAIVEFRRVASGYGEAVAGNNLAETLFELGQVDEAIGWCERTLELARRIDSPLVIANVNQTLARIAASRDDYPAAARYADDAAATFDAAGLTPEAAECRKLAEDYRAAN